MRPLLNKLPTKTVARNGDSLCDECKDVMGLIKPTIDSNSTETEVKEFLDKLCSMLPSSVSDTVRSYYGDSLTLLYHSSCHIQCMLCLMSYCFCSLFLQCNTAVNSYFDIIWSIVKEEVVS